MRVNEIGTDVESCFVIGIFGFVLVELKEVVSKIGIVADDFIVDEVPGEAGRRVGRVFFGVVFDFESPLVEFLSVPRALGEWKKEHKKDYCCRWQIHNKIFLML